MRRIEFQTVFIAKSFPTMVKDADENRVQNHVVVEVVIGRIGGNSTPTNGKGIKRLSCCILPDLQHNIFN